SKMTDSTIDEHYEAARKAGAIGGKLMGAGGGGFFMLYTRPQDKRRVIEAMAARGLRQLRFRFDVDGAGIVANLHRSASKMAASDTPRLALLDRDGPLIDVVRDEETGTITTAFHPKHLRLLDGVVEGLRTLVDARFLLAIVTNQPGPAKGHFSRDAV